MRPISYVSACLSVVNRSKFILRDPRAVQSDFDSAIQVGHIGAIISGSNYDPGVATVTVMNSGFEFVQAAASRFDSKNRSTTMAERCVGVRPQVRAAFRLT